MNSHFQEVRPRALKGIFKPHSCDTQVSALLALQAVTFSETIIGLTGREKRATTPGVRSTTGGSAAAPQGSAHGAEWPSGAHFFGSRAPGANTTEVW